MMVNRRAVILLAFTCFAFANASRQSILLGVLEDNRGHYAGDPNFRTVRAVFKKNGADWQPLRSDCADQICLKTVTSGYPREVDWTITFDGRNLGRVTGRTPSDFKWYGSVGQQEITSTGPVPTVGQKLTEGFEGGPVFRPLVANSQPYFRDPDSWKPAELSSDVIRLFRQQFRRKFPKVCRISKQDETKLEPFPYQDEDVLPVKVYRSKKEWVISQLHLSGAIDCNDLEAGFDIDDPWFVSNPQKSVEYLDAGLWLVDAGDYDNDGKSELLFYISRDNRGGYELFYDDFKKHASFEYSYH
jgi:hypothetical protein